MTGERINKRPLLSIVTPTARGLTERWKEAARSIKGDVEFVVVYPPGADELDEFDERVKAIRAPYAGEVSQRAAGLLCSRGQYVLALDDDDLAHPDLCGLVERYWKRFPDAWVLRLRKKGVDSGDKAGVQAPWGELPEVEKVPVCSIKGATSEQKRGGYIYEVPIAPLDGPVDWKRIFLPFFWPRKGQEGPHMENFVDRVWRGDLAREATRELFKATHLAGPFKYVPPKCSFGHDRVLCLFLQAKFYEKVRVIGYWMPVGAEQLRKVTIDKRYKPPRFHVLSHFLLVKHYPGYVYLWELFSSMLFSNTPKNICKTLKNAFRKERA